MVVNLAILICKGERKKKWDREILNVRMKRRWSQLGEFIEMAWVEKLRDAAECEP